MPIKDSIFKIANWTYIILSVILGLVLVYGIVNTMVSLKYENEKELIDLDTNPASDYIKITLSVLYQFLAYVLFNILYLFVMGRMKLKKTQ